MAQLDFSDDLFQLKVICNELVIWGPSQYKDVVLSYQYRGPHVKDKTVSRPSYL